MTSANIYEIGALVIMTAQFSDPTNVTPPLDPITGHTLVNPNPAPTCTVRRPDGTEVTLSVALTGFVYSAQITASKSGTWWYRFATPTGATFQGASEGFFRVRDQRT